MFWTDGSETNIISVKTGVLPMGSSSAFESSYNYYTYSETKLTMVESVLYYSGQDEEHPWFYSTEQEPDIKNAEPISQDKATEIMSKYVHEHPQYTPFVE